MSEHITMLQAPISQATKDGLKEIQEKNNLPTMGDVIALLVSDSNANLMMDSDELFVETARGEQS